MCRDECELLEEKICRMEYSIAKRHPVIGKANILPDCKKLPERESREGAKCLALGIPLPQIIQLDEGKFRLVVSFGRTFTWERFC